jgi:hypothetical protein
MDDEIARMLYAKRATPEPCHVCGGKCCWDECGYRIEHMAAEFYEHVCDACLDGDKFVPKRTADDERADVLAFLDRAVKYPFPYPAMSVYRYIETLADLIRKGDHVGLAKEKKP